MSGRIFVPVDVTEVARHAVRDWVQAALAKRMDLGYEGPQDEPVEVDGNPLMLREMLSNLIDTRSATHRPAGTSPCGCGASPPCNACTWKSRTPDPAFPSGSGRGSSSAFTGFLVAKATGADSDSRSSGRSRPCMAAN